MSSARITRIPSHEITTESVYLRRRELIKAALLPIGLLAGCGSNDAAESKAPVAAPTGRPLMPSSKSPFSTTETQTSFHDATHYNNYYEFGTGKADPAAHSHRFKAQPWSVEIAGAAEITGRFTLEDLLKPHALEERIYRMRCVEGWSMVIPWVGFPLGDLLRRFKPKSEAKFVAFTTIARQEEMPGLSYPVLDWPYREGLRMDEAMHPLTLLAVGLYGQELPNQNGAPLRLVVPWKYGYKGIKSIVRIEFTERQPATAWNLAAPDEYGFYSNVNPAVDHPRWGQSSERRISGSGSKLFADRIDTLPFNGYAEQVAGLYAGMDLKRNF